MLVHGQFAREAGLIVDVAYRSPSDPYLKALATGRDGWTQFFQPLEAPKGLPRLQLDCWSAARAWELGGNYPHAASSSAVDGDWCALQSFSLGVLAEVLSHLIHVPAHFRMPCLGSRYGYHRYNATQMQRRLRAGLVHELPIVPRRLYREAARTFWEAHFGTQTPVLGVHLRGSDKVIKASRHEANLIV